MRAKDAQDAWAISMQQSLNAVQARIKTITQKIAILETLPYGNIAKACKEVLLNTNPPTRVKDGFGVCCITGARVESCLDISRGGTGSGVGGGMGSGRGSSGNGNNRRGGKQFPLTGKHTVCACV